jgi:hypothetical protein
MPEPISDLPNELQRAVGAEWLRRYGDMAIADPQFGAAALYRIMRWALTEPNAPELDPNPGGRRP